MRDTIYNNIIMADQLVTYIIEAIYFYKCYTAILPAYSLRKSKQGKAAYWPVISVSYVLAMLILKYIPIEIDALAANGIGVLVVFILSYLVYSGNLLWKIYISVTFLAVKYLVYCLFLSANKGIANIINNIINHINQDGMEAGTKLIIIIFVVQVILTLASRLILYHAVVIAITKGYRNQIFYCKWREIAFLMIPSVLGICWGFFVNRFYVGAGGEIENSQWLFFLSAVTLLFVAGITVNATLLRNIKANKDEEKERLLIHRQIDDISSHIKKVEQIYEGIRGVRHDLRKHICNIEGLLEQENYEEAKEYIKQFDITMEQFDNPFSTGNPVVDVILNEYAAEAEKKGILFKAIFTCPINLGINAFDLSIILHNALENAMEASCLIKEGKEKWIEAYSFKRKNCYLIQVKNLFYEDIKKDERGIPISIKADWDMHGLGLKNIEQIAAKYQGGIDIEYSNNQFILTVMLQCIQTNRT